VPSKPVASAAPSVASGGALGVFSALAVATISGTRRGLLDALIGYGYLMLSIGKKETQIVLEES